MSNAPDLAPGVLCWVDETRNPLTPEFNSEYHGAIVMAQGKCPAPCPTSFIYRTFVNGTHMWTARVHSNGEQLCFPEPVLVPIPPDEIVDYRDTKKNKPVEEPEEV